MSRLYMYTPRHVHCGSINTASKSTLSASLFPQKRVRVSVFVFAKACECLSTFLGFVFAKVCERLSTFKFVVLTSASFFPPDQIHINSPFGKIRRPWETEAERHVGQDPDTPCVGDYSSKTIGRVSANNDHLTILSTPGSVDSS